MLVVAISTQLWPDNARSGRIQLTSAQLALVYCENVTERALLIADDASHNRPQTRRIRIRSKLRRSTNDTEQK